MSGTDTLKPGFAHNTEDDRGAWVVVASWIFVLNCFLVTGVRLVWRFRVSRKVLIDDWAMLVATILALCQTVTITVACNIGLGRHESALSPQSVEGFNKAYYASQILLFVTVGLSKIAVVYTIIGLKPLLVIMRICQGLQAVNILWTITSVFSLAFQCSMPTPWLLGSDRCVNQYALQLGLGALNVATDVAIIVLPSILIWRVQVTNKQRWTVSAFFGCRIIVPIMTILGLAQMHDLYQASPLDPSWHAVTPSIFNQVMMNTALITASIPTIKRFLLEFRTGAMTAEVTAEFGQSSSGGKQLSGTALSGGRKSGLRSQIKSAASATIYDSREPAATMVERSESIEGLTDNIIMQTIDFKVEYEDSHKTNASSPTQAESQQASKPRKSLSASDRSR